LPPEELSNQVWLLTLTGVVEANLKDEPSNADPTGWFPVSFGFSPDTRSPLKYAMSLYGFSPLSPKAVPLFGIDAEGAPWDATKRMRRLRDLNLDAL